MCAGSNENITVTPPRVMALYFNPADSKSMIAWARAATLNIAVKTSARKIITLPSYDFRIGDLGLLEIPQPKILRIRAMPVARLEAVALGHRAGLLIGERYAIPGVIGPVCQRTPLHLKLKQRPWPQQPADFADIALDHLAAGNVLKHDVRISEIKLALPTVRRHGSQPTRQPERFPLRTPRKRRHYRQIVPIVLVNVSVRLVGQRLPRMGDHFTADIHRVHLAEEVRECPCETSGAAANLQNPHVLGIFTLADIDHVGKDVIGNGLLTGGKELFIGPIGVAGGNIIAGVFTRAL